MTSVRLAVLAGFGATVLATPGHAQVLENFDISGGYARLSDDDVDLDAVVVRGTIHANRYLSGELEVNFGVGDDMLAGSTVELDSNWGVYARGDLPLSDTGAVFARIGYVDQQTTSTLGSASMSSNQDGWAAGVGGEVFFRGPNGVRVDYTHYDFDGEQSDAIAIAYVRRFSN